MRKSLPLSIWEIVGILFFILVAIGMFTPIFHITHVHHHYTKQRANARSIGFTLIAYAEDDVRAFKLPYPLPRGKEKVWGNSKDCWSTSVTQMLFEQKYMKLGDEGQLIGHYANKYYQPMYLDDNTINQNQYWNKKTQLDFHIYCDKDLTSNFKDKFVLIATYDNDDIRNCQFYGKGWVIFYSDKTTEFVKRRKYIEFDEDKQTNPNTGIRVDEESIAGPGIILRKNIPESEGGPGTFGNHLGGGSTELMGKKTTDAVYKALVK